MLTPSETRAPEARASKPWRLYEVTTPSRWSDGETYTATVSAPSAAAARYRRFLDISDAWPDLTFRQFVGMAKVRASSAPPSADAYDYVRRAYGLDVKHGDRVEIQGECASVNGRLGHVVHPSLSARCYVHVVLDGEDHHGLYHPNSVRPLPASLESQKEGAADSASVKERV